MRKVKFLSIAFMLVALSVFGGCSLFGGGEPEKAPSEVIKEAISNSVDNVKSSEYELVFDADLKSEGDVPERVMVKLTLSGEFDQTDLASPKFTLNLDGSGSWDDSATQNVKAEVRLDKDNLYFILNEISDFEGEFPTAMYSAYIGKWWKMAIPEGTFSEMAGIETENEALLALVKETDFFKDVSYEGTGKVKGEEVYKYNGTLDNDALAEFMKKAVQISMNEEVTEADMLELQTMLSAFELKGTFFVGVSDMTSRGMEGTITLNVPDGAGGTIKFSGLSWNHNKVVEIQAPEDATEFDPMMFLFGAMDPSMMDMDPGMMDSDFSEFDFDSMDEGDWDMEGELELDMEGELVE